MLQELDSIILRTRRRLYAFYELDRILDGEEAAVFAARMSLQPVEMELMEFLGHDMGVYPSLRAAYMIRA